MKVRFYGVTRDVLDMNILQGFSVYICMSPNVSYFYIESESWRLPRKS